MNIIRRQIDLSRLDGLGEEGHEAQHLISAMVSADPRQRPSATDVLSHPYFWDSNRRLTFLQDASDRFECMERDPPHPALVALETDYHLVVGPDWFKKVDKVFIEDLGKFRGYDGKSVQDLLRALRNKVSLRRKVKAIECEEILTESFEFSSPSYCRNIIIKIWLPS